MRLPHVPGLAFALSFAGLALLATSSTHAAQKTERSPPPGKNPVDAILAQVDKNRDGKLDKDEMKIFKETQADEAAKALKFDADKDGLMAAPEVIAWRAASAPPPPPPKEKPKKKN